MSKSLRGAAQPPRRRARRRARSAQDHRDPSPPAARHAPGWVPAAAGVAPTLWSNTLCWRTNAIYRKIICACTSHIGCFALLMGVFIRSCNPIADGMWSSRILVSVTPRRVISNLSIKPFVRRQTAMRLQVIIPEHIETTQAGREGLAANVFSFPKISKEEIIDDFVRDVRPQEWCAGQNPVYKRLYIQ